MAFDFGQWRENLVRQLEGRGYNSTDAILESAEELSGTSYHDIQSQQAILLKDRVIELEGGVAEIQIERFGETEPWRITQIAGSALYYTDTEKEKGKRVDVFTEPGETFLTKGQLINRLRRKIEHEKVKDSLFINEPLKKQIESLGFVDYEEMIKYSSYVLGLTTLHSDFNVNPKIGTGKDKIDFFINLGFEESPAFKQILNIHALYDLPISFSDGEKEEARMVYFPKNGKFPHTDKMAKELLAKVRAEFLKYAKAYKVSTGISEKAGNYIRNIWRRKF